MDYRGVLNSIEEQKPLLLRLRTKEKLMFLGKGKLKLKCTFVLYHN